MSEVKKKKYLTTVEFDVRSEKGYFLICSVTHQVWNQMDRIALMQKPDEDEVTYRTRLYETVLNTIDSCDIRVYALPKKMAKPNGDELTDVELKVKALNKSLELVDTIKDPLTLQYYNVADEVYPALMSRISSGVSVGKRLLVR